MQTFVYCTFTHPGIHLWPNAPDKYPLLKVKHRHLFHFKLAVKVGHDNRDVEFIELRDQALFEIEYAFGKRTADFAGMSCEMIAEWLIAQMQKKYDLSVALCEVSEDGENGAIIHVH